MLTALQVAAAAAVDALTTDEPSRVMSKELHQAVVEHASLFQHVDGRWPGQDAGRLWAVKQQNVASVANSENHEEGEKRTGSPLEWTSLDQRCGWNLDCHGMRLSAMHTRSYQAGLNLEDLKLLSVTQTASCQPPMSILLGHRCCQQYNLCTN